MVLERHHHRAHDGRRQTLPPEQGVGRHDRVQAHALPLLGIQSTRLVEDVWGHTYLARVVQKAGQAELAHHGLVQTKPLTQYGRKHSHVGGVQYKVAVEVLDGSQSEQSGRVTQDLVHHTLGHATGAADDARTI